MQRRQLSAPLFRRLVCILLLIVCHPIAIFGVQEKLTPQDVLRVMDQLLDYHVQVKEINGELVQRSYEIYLQQFDHHRLYLLEAEVRPFLQPNPQELQRALERYQAGDLSDYARLDSVIQLGIRRAREWRSDLMSQAQLALLRGETTPRGDEHPLPLYCATLDQLRDRQLRTLIAFGQRKTQDGRVRHSHAPLQEAWSLYTKQANQREYPYLNLNGRGAILTEEDREHHLAERALKALAQSLDSHTAYYSPTEAFQLRMQLQQEFTGVGLELEDAADGVEVTRVIDGGPAARNGSIAANDRIVEIDGESIEHLPYSEVLCKLRGPKGSWIALGVQRPASAKQAYFTVTLQRDYLPAATAVPSSAYQHFGEGIIGVIRLDSFYEGTDSSAERDVRDALTAFKERGRVVGIVLDLRMNLGGFLSQAVKVAGLFITNGVIAVSKYSDGVEVYFRDVDGVAQYDGPMVVLTSKASASAAEIVAQSLQDYGQALVVGDPRTYGKGSIQHQTITDETAQDYFKVTVGRYYTVSGRSTQVTGVQADIIVPTILYNERIGEEYLEYPLEPDQIQPVFDDALDDLDPLIRAWFIKYYLPTLQQQRTIWKEHLPTLKKNSEYRLKTSPNFQLFLDTLNEQGARGLTMEEARPSYGRDDLQLNEAINVLKDMILLQETQQDAA